MDKFYVRFNCKTEPASRQQRWVHDSSFMEQLEKMGRNAPTVHTARLRVMCGWHVLFSLLVGKQPLPANSHGHHLPANIWISKRNDSHISVWYFLDQNCCTCAMRSVSSMFNTSQAAAGKCNVKFVWNLLKGHFFLGFLQYPQPMCGLRSHGQKTGGNWRWHINVIVFVMLNAVELANATSPESSP